MFLQILWWTAIAGGALILVRSRSTKLYRKYPAFYLYLGAVLCISLLRFSVYDLASRLYVYAYWYTEFLARILGYAVIVEIYKHALKSFPDLARVARNFLLAVPAAVLLKVLVNASSNSSWWTMTMAEGLDHDLIPIETFLLGVVIAFLVCYRIPIGRNLKGIVYGYTLYASARALFFAFEIPKYQRQEAWWYIYPAVYPVALLIWAFTLWSYHPNPETEHR